ncbi:MAG: hypothetical protein M1531_10060 [Chloroflexi bacterium]|nr:hypothetical protein [Chloroflexota bacterium]
MAFVVLILFNTLMKAGLYFSAAFTLQRTIISELAYLALAPVLLSPAINGIVYIVVGIVMSAAGALVLYGHRYPHLDIRLLAHPEGERQMEMLGPALEGYRPDAGPPAKAPPTQWALVHGFIAGFGFGGFALFVNTVAVPAMPGPWLGFLPGLLFGLGTMAMQMSIGAVFGASLRWRNLLTEDEIKRVGGRTGGRALFYGGMLFAVFGLATLLGMEHYLPVDLGYALITLFMIAVVIPAFVFSWREVMAMRRPSDARS